MSQAENSAGRELLDHLFAARRLLTDLEVAADLAQDAALREAVLREVEAISRAVRAAAWSGGGE